MRNEPRDIAAKRGLTPRAGHGATFVSAYSGCGGLDLGFVQAGFQPLWANDVDPIACETYRGLLGDHIVVGGIDEVSWPRRGAADLVVGGPPCQGFSVAGKMNPGDPRSEHVDRFLDLVAHVRPTAFVMENVKALAVSGRWAGLLARLERRARAMRFRTSLLILNAADFGAAQRRERMFLVGLRGGASPTRVSPRVDENVTVGEAFAELPPFGEPGNDTYCVAQVTPAKRPVLRPTPWRGSLLFNGNGRPLHPDRTAPTLSASMGGNATPIIDQRQLETGEESWIAEYHRCLLRGGEPATSTPPQIRRITVEEAAQLQSFPPGMAWAGTTSARFRQIGNAVPPCLALGVAEVVGAALGLSADGAGEPGALELELEESGSLAVA